MPHLSHPPSSPAWPPRGRAARRALLALSIAAAAAASHAQFGPRAFKLPESFSPLAQQGQQAFDAHCASCHGRFGVGSDKGPPLIHDIYNPGHHGDASFFAAAERGVRRHHWRFGDMPPQPKVSREQVTAIVRYVREIQLANGIVFKPHKM